MSGTLSMDPAPWWNEGAFLYVGRLGANKGVLEILAAWLSLRSRCGSICPDLWLAGGAPDEIAELHESLPKSPRLVASERAGRLRWWGYLDEPGISALLLKARALIMHSAYEPGGRVVLEAMTMGVPVIATPHGFACDLVRDWVNGFLVPHGDIRLLAKRMEHFARQPLLSASLGFAARATAHAALTDWDFYRAHGRVYREVPFRAEPGPQGSPAATAEVVADPSPRALVARYPFPAALPETRAALAAATNLLGLPAAQCRIHARGPTDGALEWELARGAERWSIRHFYSVYSDRPLWDRASSGPLLEPGAERRRRAAVAGGLPGFVATRFNPTAEFQVEEALSPIDGDAPAAQWRAAALQPLQALWAARIDEEEARSMREIASQWWLRRDSRPWRGDPIQAAWLRRASLRAVWPELGDKLLRKEIRVRAKVAAAFAAAAAAGAQAAKREEELASLCFQHGDFQPHMLGTANGRVHLTGGAALGIGWWGRDAARLVWLSPDPEAGGARPWKTAIGEICPNPDLRPIVGAWLAVEAVEELARALAFGTASSGLARRVEQLLGQLAADVSR